MLLSKIVANYPTKEKLQFDVQINKIEFDSRKVEKGDLFFALLGGSYDGFNYIEQAVLNGAVCVVTDRPCNQKIKQIIVDDVRHALAFFCANFYGNPQNDLKIIGVVGTNGKTSTCHILSNVLQQDARRTAVFGTLGISFEGYFCTVNLTTPDPIELFETLKIVKDRGAKYVVMEVSAHAIYFKKVAPIFFETLIFTNCTQDHLDFFETFEDYKNVKMSIFDNKNAKFLIVNSDDEVGNLIIAKADTISYGVNNVSDVFAVNAKETAFGVEYVLNVFDQIYQISAPLLGSFSIYNTMSACVTAKLLGVKLEVMASAIKTMPQIDGRLEKVAVVNGASVFVDYAHTPDGLEKSLTSVRHITKNNLFCLFGCGGNRDKLKRPVMGRIAGDLADFVVLTSDNPRFEDANQIIADVEKGLRESTLDYICITKRKQAIIYALKNLQSGDTLLIAGKGAETYQEVNGVKKDFSDKKVVTDFIKNG